MSWMYHYHHLNKQKSYLSVNRSASHSVSYLSQIDGLQGEFDVAFVATPAHCRSKLISDLVTTINAKYWKLEKVLAQSSFQLKNIQDCLAGHPSVWVNTARRIMPWHQKIKSYLMETGFNSLDVRVRGSSWGMACNSIHFIDLVCWWTGASIVSVEIDQLDNWIPAKRKGFYEVNGILSVRFSDFSSLVCECSHGDPSCQIEVKTPCGFLLIDESVGLASSSIGLEISGEVPYQSSLTTTLLTQLLDSGM